ncbi:hypothetical protein GCM10009541_00670 [Micromonospora gifhornensis]|uniref:Uncharacterized protein n=1 Tax=Micromonospora gifhornensis TaxID=84594 RepID=A0ABQ4IJD2_9ACTN|nr:hypothetical protein [Micromonospora gifhornensis]GIJ18011.1 hypothetical protein Vgi01_46950 [Micromonospora gifhornensis]
MSALRQPGERAGPGLERLFARTFTHPVIPCDPADRANLRDRMEKLYGDFTDVSWLTDGPMVSYHDMVRTVVQELGPELVDVDLAITVDASPDCRHQSFPGPVLSHLLPGDPIMLGVSEQGVAGPYTALRIAHQYLRSGAATRALILIMEQSTLPPDDAAVRPVRDVAVALLLGPEGTVELDLPTVAVTRAEAAGALTNEVDLVVAGAALADLPTGVPVRRAEPGHPCAGVWLALAELLDSRPDGGRVLVADRDPVLPYRCAVTVTLPTSHPEPPRHPAGDIASPAMPHLAIRPQKVRELVR